MHCDTLMLKTFVDIYHEKKKTAITLIFNLKRWQIKLISFIITSRHLLRRQSSDQITCGAIWWGCWDERNQWQQRLMSVWRTHWTTIAFPVQQVPVVLHLSIFWEIIVIITMRSVGNNFLFLKNRFWNFFFQLLLRKIYVLKKLNFC